MRQFAVAAMCVFFSLTVGTVLAQQGRTGNSPQPTRSAASSEELEWCDTYTESIEKAKTTGKPLLILFTGSDWCPACMKLEREVLSKPEFVRGVSDNFVFYRAEFSDPSPEALASTPDSVLLDRYNVNMFPTIVVIDGNGKQLFSLNYKAGGPNVYVQELNQKLRTYKNASSQSRM